MSESHANISFLLSGVGESRESNESNVKVQGSLLFVTYKIIQGIISSEMQVDRGRKNTA